MKIAGHDPRPDVRKKPAAHLAVDLRQRPIAFLGNWVRTGVRKFFRKPRKYRFRQFQPFCGRDRHGTGCGVHEQVVNVDVDAELWARSHELCSFPNVRA